MLQYVTLSADILELDLTLTEKFILALSKLPEGCFMSNESIGKMVGLSKSRVSHIISKLVKEGYITCRLEFVGKQISKRTITFKQVAKDLVEACKKACEKAKQIKADYVTQTKKVGTETVQQVSFGSNFYTRPTYNKTTKQAKFTTTYSHNWDIDTLEQLEMQRLEEIHRRD